MKNKFFFLIVISLILFNAFLLFNNNSKKEETNVYLNSLKSVYEDKFIVEKQNENLKLDKNLKLLTVDGDSVLVKDIFNNNKIVLKYSLLNCGACIDAEYQVLRELSKNFDNELCIIAYYDRVRDLIGDYKKLKEIGLDEVTIYLIPDDKLGVPLDKQNIPYYFLIDNDLTMTNLFIPMKESPKLSINYLKSNLKNVFNKK